jgi:cyanophycin synthetase
MALLATGSAEVVVANVQSVVDRLNTAPTATPTEASSITAQAVLAAIATAWALGIVPELISAGLDTFAVEPSAPAPTVNTTHLIAKYSIPSGA